MKLSARDANRYFGTPEADRTGLLIYGPAAVRVALKRQAGSGALLGPRGGQEEGWTASTGRGDRPVVLRARRDARGAEAPRGDCRFDWPAG